MHHPHRKRGNSMDNVTALKNLAAVITGTKADKIDGDTIADVINYIADNYPKNENAEG